jgi:hypothetical protein
MLIVANSGSPGFIREESARAMPVTARSRNVVLLLAAPGQQPAESLQVIQFETVSGPSRSIRPHEIPSPASQGIESIVSEGVPKVLVSPEAEQRTSGSVAVRPSPMVVLPTVRISVPGPKRYGCTYPPNASVFPARKAGQGQD